MPLQVRMPRRSLAIAARALLLVALCALIATYAPLHDFELVDSHGGSQGQQMPDHDHPVLAAAVATLLVMLISVSLLRQRPTHRERLSPALLPTLRKLGAIRCDDDVGLYTLLSTFRI